MMSAPHRSSSRPRAAAAGARLRSAFRFVTTLPLLLLVAMPAAGEIAYPTTHKGDVVDDYHGTKIADPFRWLEDDHSEKTKAWVKAQNRVTFGFLEQIPQRPKIRERLKELWNYERLGVPQQRGGRYFFSRNTGLQNQSVLLVADRLAAEPRVLLDPNGLSADGTVALTDYALSEDGALLAYGLSREGSDWQQWRVREVASGRDREDLVEWVKFSRASWAHNGSGFYYSRFDAPVTGAQLTGVNEFQKLYFHRLGTPQSDDRLIYERRDHKDWGFHGEVTDDGDHLVITVTQGTDPKNRLFYKDLAAPDSAVVELLNQFDAGYDFIDNDGPIFFFKTDLDAPLSRVLAIDITNPARANWREIISQSGDPLKNVNIVNRQLICAYLHDAQSAVKIFALKDGTASFLREISFPGTGTAAGFGGRRDETETFYSFTTYTTPGTIYRLDLTTGEVRVFRQPKVSFDPAQYETRQIFYRSKDGTRIPMFIVHQRGLKLDGSNPTLLYGYGGFEIPLTPEFSEGSLAWMEMGGVFAVANLRGGGEYGTSWHRAGIKARKQNVFDDFIAAAEWLIAERYTSARKLAIRGRSNGGLLVGACMTQRPELFGAALPEVGVLDMLRFHKFTIGWAWTSDYGSSDHPEEFQVLRAYSPLHALKPGVRYPATLISTADHDDRVVPAHSFKFAARLQECQPKDGPPVLIRIDTEAGHGAGKALGKVIEQTADVFAFLVRVLAVDETR